MVFLVTWKNEEDPIKSEGTRDRSVLRCSRGANSIIGYGILTKFKLIQALIIALLVYKNEENPFKLESARVVTTFLPLSVYGDIPDAQVQLTPQYKVRSGQILNPFENLYMSMSPAKMKKIQSKVKALER